MADGEWRRVETPSENELRLQAWARVDFRSAFIDPLTPADSWTTLGLALRTLSQEVLELRARVAQLEAERDG